MNFLCHIKLDSYKDQDDQTSPYEEHVGIIEATSKQEAIAACEAEVGKWNMHRATISVAPFGKFMQIR